MSGGMRVYLCRKCGQPRKGHICPGYPVASNPEASSSSYGKRKADDGVGEQPQTQDDAMTSSELDLLLQPHMEALKQSLSSTIMQNQRPPPKPSACPNAYDEIIAEVCKQYYTFMKEAEKDRDAEVAKQVAAHASAVAAYAATAASGSGATVTTYVVEFLDHHNNWTAITDQNVISLITALDAETDSSKWTVSYNTNSHSYTATKDSSGAIVQTNTKFSTQRQMRVTSHSTPATASSPPAPPPPPPCWQARVYFESWPVCLDSAFIQRLLQTYDYGLTDEIIAGQVAVLSSQVAQLGTMFDSMGLNTKFSPKRSELWCNPSQLATFLRMSLKRQYFQMRIVVHGSGSYDTMRNDANVFDHTFLTASRMGHGIYVATSPHIAFDYKKSRGGSGSSDAPSKYPPKTILIGLLLRQGSGLPNATYDSTLSYEQYHLGSSCYNEGEFGNARDAFVVRDQSHLCWLGLCVP